MTELEQLKAKYALDDSTRQEILEEIIRIETDGVKKSKIPKLVMLGAQPGAGKTEVQIIAQFLNPNLITCNSDNLRGYHLFADDINTNHENLYPDLTVEYAQAWNRDLIKYSRENKFDVLLETTFRDPELINQTLKDFKASGYETEINLLAVNSQLSLLGTYLRFEQMKARLGVGRPVSKTDHDVRYNAISNTLKSVNNAKLFDTINIYGRNVYNNNIEQHEGVYLVKENPVDPLETYLNERDKPLSEKANIYISKTIDRVVEMMKSRGATTGEIFSFENNLSQEKKISYKR